jgi:hypothetical protein
MSCPDCDQAKVTPNWGGYRTDCKGCTARAAARSQAFWESRQQGRQTGEYRAMLKRLGVTHEQVKEWAA